LPKEISENLDSHIKKLKKLSGISKNIIPLEKYFKHILRIEKKSLEKCYLKTDLKELIIY
jgi:hypothetical protein